MKDTWHKLNLTSNTSLPTLYAKYVLGVTNCHILLTDLTRVWSEDLTRDQLLQRAAEIGTSIDPSEDREQLNVLHQKVQDALQGKRDTRLQLTADDNSTDLKLKTLTHLPTPFRLLEWHFKLSLLKQGAITEELLLPLLHDHEGLLGDIKALTSKLEEKDHVISKLLDKIEGSGLNLTDVFPSLRGRKTMSRSVAESAIPGLSVFNPTAFGWKSDTARLLVDHGDHGFGFVRNDLPSLKSKTPDEQWWAEISDDSDYGRNGSIGKDNGGNTVHPPESQSQASENDFQTQTSPQARSCSGEEHSAGPNQSLVPPKPATQPSKKKLGKIGGTNRSPSKAQGNSNRSPERITPASPHQPLEKLPSPLPQTTISPTGKRTSRIGTIGGNRSEKIPTPDPGPPGSHTGDATSPLTSPKTKSRLGTIGGKQHRAAKDDDKETATTPAPKNFSPQHTEAAPLDKSPVQAVRKKEQKSKSPVPKETEEEKADRKRQELKRQLDTKARAPVKKKRMF